MKISHIFSFHRNYVLNIKARADDAILTVPSNPIVSIEDNSIPIPGLSAALKDNNPANGEEVLSVVMSGVPEGSRFNAGSLNGDGTWSIPVDALETLVITPPDDYSGTMDLTLLGLTFESSNGDESSFGKPFQIVVEPVADPLLIVPEQVNVGRNEFAPTNVELNIRALDDTGTSAGERLPEYVIFTFECVPLGIRFVPLQGGRLIDDGSGRFVFTGTVEQTNALSVVSGSGSVEKFDNIVDVTAVTVDGDTVLSPAVTDSFRVRVTFTDDISLNLVAPNNSDTELVGDRGADVLVGLGGNDILNGGAGSDLLIGGGGANLMTGGAGVDIFQFANIGDVDTITDFSIAEDILDFSRLFESQGIDYDPQLFSVAENLELVTTIDGTLIRFRSNDVVLLQGVTGTTLQDLFNGGSLLV